METSLVSSDRLFRTTYERAVIGIAHVSPEGRWLRFNQQLCEILGYDSAELAARTFHDITHPDDRDVSDAYFQRLLAGELDTYELDKRYIRKDGTPIWVHLTVSLVRTPEGAPDYSISMVQDITERKRLEQERAHLLEQEHAARAEAEEALVRATESEAQTAERAERLRAILETIADAVAVFDRCGRIVQSNRAYHEMLTTDRVPGFDALPLADRAPFLDMRDSATGEPVPLAQFPATRALRGEVTTGTSTDFRIRAIDGRELEVNISAGPLHDGERRIVGAVLVLRDITSRKRLERERDEALAQATERAEHLNTILETIADAVAVFDPDGSLVQSNRAYRELLATDRVPDFETLPMSERNRLLDLRDSATGQPLPLDRLPGMRSLHGEVVTSLDADKRIRAFDGRELEVSVSAAPLRDPDGRIVGAVMVMRDQTQRKWLEHEREKALAQAITSEAQTAERAEQLRAILETMADAVSVYDQDGQVVQSNRAYHELFATDRVPGFDALSLADRAPFLDLRDAATGELVPLAQFPAMRALRGEVVTKPEAEYLIHAMDGREVGVSISAAPLRDGDGRIVGSVSVLRDQTQRKRLEHEREEARAHELALRELDQRKDEFLNLLGHEIRTPLTSVQGYIQLLIRHFNTVSSREPGDQGGQEAAHLTRDIAMARTMLAYSEASLQRLTRLANDLIDDVRIRDGQLTVCRTACDLCAIVRAAVEEQRVLEDNRQIHLELPDAQPVPVIADPDRIGQVVTNYLTNALKYSKAERPITARLEVEGDMARVSVRDEGPGISLSDQMHVFERFPRIKGTAVQCGSGVSMGLGLHISKAIIEAHGGLVGVESASGKGSTFWFAIPLARQPGSQMRSR